MKLFALVILFVFAESMSAYATGVSFPGKSADTCVSPNQKWCIRCESQEQDSGEYVHQLFLNRVGQSDKVSIWESGRSCDTLWSDDSQHIAVTDWSGSNVAGIFLVDVQSPSRAVELDVKNIRDIAQKAELAGHVYYEAVKWESSRQLLIRVFGHTDELNSSGHGFTYYLSVNISSGLGKLVMKLDDEMFGWR